VPRVPNVQGRGLRHARLNSMRRHEWPVPDGATIVAVDGGTDDMRLALYGARYEMRHGLRRLRGSAWLLVRLPRWPRGDLLLLAAAPLLCSAATPPA
jgi:hypothetical protein